MGAYWNCLREAIPVSTPKICFGAKIKIIINYCLSYHLIWTMIVPFFSKMVPYELLYLENVTKNWLVIIAYMHEW